MKFLRRDSLRHAPVWRVNGGDARAIRVPADFLQAMPVEGSIFAARRLDDGSVILTVGEADLADAVVETLRQIQEGRGRVADRRYDLLRRLCTAAEWAEAEDVVRHTSAMSGEPLQW